MNDLYMPLFSEIALAAENAAEQVKEYDEKKNDIEGLKAAQVMYQDYVTLGEKLRKKEALQRNDFIKLLLGSMIATNNMETRLELLQKTINKYKTLITPKLQRIMNETTTDEEAQNLANELFKENKN